MHVPPDRKQTNSGTKSDHGRCRPRHFSSPTMCCLSSCHSQARVSCSVHTAHIITSRQALSLHDAASFRMQAASARHVPGRTCIMQIWSAHNTEYATAECCRLTCRLRLPGSGLPCQFRASVQCPVAVAVHRAARCLPVRLPAAHPGGLRCSPQLLHIPQGMHVTT